MTRQELDIIARYGEAFSELLNGKRIPQTPAQEHFIDACRGRVKPTTKHEVAFIKHLLRGQFDRAEERRRQELRDRKIAKDLRAEVDALEMQKARKRNEASCETPYSPPTPVVLQKRRTRENPEVSPPPEIPEFEEGYPRPGWFTDEDWKKLRSRYP